MAEETEQITPEAEQESFREYVERREDEVSGRNLERDKQAQSIADAVLRSIQQAAVEEESSEAAPARDPGTGRFVNQGEANNAEADVRAEVASEYQAKLNEIRVGLEKRDDYKE